MEKGVGQPHQVVEEGKLIAAEKYLPLVRRIALALKVRLPRTVDVDDLISCGSVGLLEAAKTFDPVHGCSFGTYARRRIRGAMLDYLRSLDPISRHCRNKVRRGDAEAPMTLSLDRTLRIRDRWRRGGDVLKDGKAGPLERAGDSDAFDRLLATLSKRLKLICRLVYQDGLSKADAGRTIGISPSLASRRHGEALQLVREDIWRQEHRRD